MKKLLIVFVLLASFILLPFPSQVNASGSERSASSSSSSSQVRTRYVRVRGKRYRVTYRLFKKKGRWYYRILRIRRA